MRTVSGIFSDALECIISSAGGSECENFTGPPYCRSVGSGHVAKYGADQWCATCIARHALETAHEASDEILRMEVPKGYRIVPNGQWDRLVDQLKAERRITGEASQQLGEVRDQLSYLHDLLTKGATDA